MGYTYALSLHLPRWLTRLWFCTLGFGSMLQFGSSSSVLVQGFRFGPVLQFWLMLRFWASALVPALVLAVAFGFDPLFQFWPLFAFAVRGHSRGAPVPSCGLGRRVWPGASGSMMGAGLLPIPWDPCGVLGLLGSSLGWWACSVLV